jgi:histidinol dehydrogenase
MGGAQAIAALAYGTESVPAVDKITGPGNAWVAEAKRQVSNRVGIDLHAGPSEVLVYAERGADAWRIATDLVAQAEHDPLAIPLCVTTDAGLAAEVERAVENELSKQPNPVAAESLSRNGWVLLAGSREAAIEFINRYAPEHLQIEGNAAIADQITAAGAIFVGGWSPEPVGDYYAGPNHTLPTGGFARFQSALGTTGVG